MVDGDSNEVFCLVGQVTYTWKEVLFWLMFWHIIYNEYCVPDYKGREIITNFFKKWWEEALSVFLNEPYVEDRPFGQKESICLPSLKDQETKVCAKVSKGGLSFEKGDPVLDDSKPLKGK